MIYPESEQWNSQSHLLDRGVYLLFSELCHSGAFKKEKTSFEAFRWRDVTAVRQSAISMLSTWSRSHYWSWNAAYRSSVLPPHCTSTSWPKIHLSLTQDTFLMALLSLPRWRSISKRAMRDLCKDTARKSQPAHSDALTELKHYAADVEACVQALNNILISHLQQHHSPFTHTVQRQLRGSVCFIPLVWFKRYSVFTFKLKWWN